MKIQLTQGKHAQASRQDYALVSQYKWYWTPCKWHEGYATTYIKGKTIYMHRLILGLAKGYQADHINHNGLDNRRSNLRKVTQHQNNGNLRKPSHNTSGYKGVSFYKSNKTKPWTAYIQNMGKKIHLGYFETAENAAMAYNKAATTQWGKYAYINNIKTLNEYSS
jgi:hypothetical protein